MGDLAKFAREHPEVLFLLVIGVVVLAVISKSSSGSSAGGAGDVQFTGGGVAAAPVDPGVVSMETARISANQANLSTLSQLTLGLTSSAYARDVQEGQTSAALTASLAQTEAQKAVGLAQIEGDVSMNATNVAGQIQQTLYNTSAQSAQAAINANTASSIAASNLAAIQDTNATQRDVARVQAKSSEVNTFTRVVGDVVKIFEPWTW